MTQQTLHPMLNIAVKAARAAGAIINRGSMDLDLLKINTKSPNDFVTEVDQLAEEAIIDTILQAYPGHGILAEEAAASGATRAAISSGSSTRSMARPTSSTASRSTACPSR
jgi:myo-inositol-1(or 4)-monophosphatase